MQHYTMRAARGAVSRPAFSQAPRPRVFPCRASTAAAEVEDKKKAVGEGVVAAL
jgi:hypothetical protein